jgi:hypothetical protein
MGRKKTNKRKRVKTRRTKSNNRGRGGDIITIDLRQILLTNPIKDAVKEISNDDEFDFSGYKTARDNHGFRLHKVENMMGIEDFEGLLEREPIVVQKIIGSGNKINGKIKQLYEVVDGRHRFARAIIEGMTTIQVLTM